MVRPRTAMAQNTKELRRRIKSTKSVRQITKAMEMIAASKVRKVQLATLAARPYANLAWNMLEALGRAKTHEDTPHSLLASSKRVNIASRQLVLLVSSNRGLCGSLNAQNAARALEVARMADTAQFVAVGRKGERALLREKQKILAAFRGFETLPAIAEIRPIAKILMEEFAAGNCDRVTIAYADFISTLRYESRAQIILPIARTRADQPREGFFQEQANKKANRSANLPINQSAEYIFEPSPAGVLDHLLPRLIELQVYQAILENLASEHSARMVAMRNASDAAGELIQDFTLTYNSVRQAAITTELADIVGGRSVLARH